MFQINFKNMFDKKYTDIMIDIETVDTKPTAGILSIAAVPFDIDSDRTYHLPYYDMLEIHKQIACGRSMSLDTMLWWTKQNEEARKEAFSGYKKLHHSLADLRLFIKEKCIEGVRVWANSPSFDLAILKNAVEAQKDFYNADSFWKYWQERDVRTYANIFPSEIDKLELKATHLPVQDCLDQILKVRTIYTRIHT